MELSSSASNQKMTKLSIISNESSDYNPDLYNDYEIAPRPSQLSLSEDLDLLIQTLKKALSTKGIPTDFPINSIDTLKVLVTTICTEFLKATQNTKEIYMKNEKSLDLEEISVNLVPHKKHDPLSKIFEIPETGVTLNKEECENIAALLVGAIRDSSSHELREKMKRLQDKIIVTAQRFGEMKRQLEQKDKEINRLKEEMEKILSAKRRNLNAGRLLESESTLNESCDFLTNPFSNS